MVIKRQQEVRSVQLHVNVYYPAQQLALFFFFFMRAKACARRSGTRDTIVFFLNYYYQQYFFLRLPRSPSCESGAPCSLRTSLRALKKGKKKINNTCYAGQIFAHLRRNGYTGVLPVLHAGLGPKHNRALYVLFSLFRLRDGPPENCFFQIRDVTTSPLYK